MQDRTFDAVIFDLDGTLIDTESAAIAAGREAFTALGIAEPDDILHRLIGTDEPTGARILGQAYPALDLAALQTLWQQGFNTRIDTHLPLKPGAAEVLARIAHPKALCTSSAQTSARRKLQRSGLTGHFTCVTTLACVTRPKPDPEPYLVTADRLGVRPDRCLVFEDSETGARSAFAAGCFVVQVPDIVPATGDHAHLVAPDLIAGAVAAGLI